MPAATAAALQSLRPAEVVIVGGSGVVSDATVRRVHGLLPGARTVRWAGADRFATSVTVSERAGLSSQAVVVVNGLGYADALAAGAAAAQLGGTLLLTDGRNEAAAGSVYAHIAGRHRGARTLVVGGPSAITPQVHNRVVRAVAGNAR